MQSQPTSRQQEGLCGHHADRLDTTWKTLIAGAVDGEGDGREFTAVTRISTVFALACVALLAACAAADPHACAGERQAMVTEMLYFGTARPAGQVSADEWRAFVDDVVTPRFPEGLSVWSASGQWKSATGTVVREPSHVLNIVHRTGARNDVAIREIVDAYKIRFQQESVLRVEGSACVSF
jgi:hypothetical protein